MKKWKQAMGVALAVCVMAGAANAARAEKSTVTASLYPDCHIVIDGVDRTFYNVSGEEVHPILYNGTTYLPVRAIGELMGENVDWNEETLTITIGGRRTTQATNGTPDKDAESERISAQLRPDFTVVVDGKTRTFTNVNGDAVYPLLYDGSTYLPVRSIGELMGKEVNWNSNNKTVTLGDAQTVTDADTFGDGQKPGQNQKPQDGQISADKAQSIALEHAEVRAKDATFVRSNLDWDDGRWVYEVEFYTADGMEYDYEIDAVSGAVVQYDHDAEYYKPQQSDNGTLITESKAGQIALDRVSGASENNLRIKLDYDDGRPVYEGEIFYNSMEYEFEIDGYTGTVLEWSAESIYD